MSSLDSQSLGAQTTHGLIPPLSLAGSSTPLAHQVAGHQIVRADASGSLVIKVSLSCVQTEYELIYQPSLPKEIALYQMVNAAPRTSRLARLKRYIPQFFGTLRLEGRMDNVGQFQADVEAEIPEVRLLPLLASHVQDQSLMRQSVVLQNLSYAFTKPNIMDAKLGTVLYEPGATEEKKAKMEKQAKETTIGSTGLRLTGCQVSSQVHDTPVIADQKTWHAPSQTFMLTPKSFGKSIKAEEMPSGMIRFFPSPTDEVPSLVPPPTPPASASTTEDKTPIPTIGGEVPEATGKVTLLEGIYRNHAIPAKTMLRVLALIDKQLSDLETVLQSLEMRFVGASVLIVYEGDLSRLEDALTQWESKIHEEDPLKPVEEEDDEDMIESESEDESEDDLDGTKEDEKMAKECPPVIVKMIDFAHTWIAEGQGVDEGVLKGLTTLRSLIRGRKAELEALA
jgi:1D-myo-inositol-tetrakisphosphate 5-kinase/inositol-polyphosphate multikinase